MCIRDSDGLPADVVVLAAGTDGVDGPTDAAGGWATPRTAEAVRQSGYDVRTEEVSFAVGGMTCAACVGRVEKALQGADGVVEASVNLATERARVRYATGTDVEALYEAVRKTGYDVVEADSAATALDLIARDEPCLLYTSPSPRDS